MNFHSNILPKSLHARKFAVYFDVLVLVFFWRCLQPVFPRAHRHVVWTLHVVVYVFDTPQWGAADAEIKVPSGENTELKRFPFQAWRRSVYSQPYMLRLQPGSSSLLISTLSVCSPAFFQKPLPIFSCAGLQNKIGHPAGCRFLCWVPAAYKRLKKQQHDLWKDDDLWNNM